jgi:hypothetical protein
VSKHEDWGTVVGQFPTIGPIGENVTMKNAIFNTLVERVEINSGIWAYKTEFFMPKFEDIVPAAKPQANMVIKNLDDIRTAMFSFVDMEILDVSLSVIPRGNSNINFTQPARDCTHYLCFTLTVSPRLIDPRVMEVNPQTFPAQTSTSTTVFVHALLEHGSLAEAISKNLVDTTPKLVILLYIQAHTEFDVSIQYRSDTAPDQERYAKWLSKTKSFAG